MREFFKKTIGKVCIAVLAVLVLAGGGFGGYEAWLYQQPKFHDVTVELGTESVSLLEFMTEYANASKVGFVTDPSAIDLNLLGTQELVLQHGRKQETVYLHVVDTTAPEATFRDVHADLTDVLTAGDFVESASDLSGPVTVAFVKGLTQPESYGQALAEIVVADSSGNETRGQCQIFYVWMKASYTLELGDTLEKEDILMNAEKDSDLLDQLELDKINAGGIGSYTLTSTEDGLTCKCEVTVQDTTAPELVLKDVTIYMNGRADKDSFIESVSDISGPVTTRLLTTLNRGSYGSQTVTIEAEDINGNVITKEATLHVVPDTTAPSISGTSTMKVEKNSTPDYLDGVTAYDGKDGYVEVTYDDSKVDLTAAGTYYVVYSATDRSGNTATSKRKVEVKHDSSDTTALVNSIAASLPSDAEAIRDYVRNNIAYNTNWGGDDPVWYGFTNKVGNCYVHALCLQRLLSAKGYSTKLIWVTNKSHYWLIINLGGTWWHIDATPTPAHSKYSLMNDEMRLATLNGRKWDFESWPACDG